MSSCRAGIFIATMTGTAEICAEEIATALSAAGVPADRKLMDGLGLEAFADYELIVIVSSTYGHGDIPDNGQKLFSEIELSADLKGRGFAVFGLGDMTYAATFCAAGHKWDDLLASKGATRAAALLQHDASDGTLAEDVAGAWAASWSSSFSAAA